ncbi:restriction endonuclease subunit S [Serratia liquefaciens]|uniref:restriction endonuclease subunit S n=1 Tax=Serratia liquefaciens TaxID=614 RepID=UPI00215711E0|nr:restriction endonuclease subunit S [Serratia liquefaciens]CAI1853512.1 Type I restriction enzyme EcoKI specificity protein [Serratia liquefaciens]
MAKYKAYPEYRDSGVEWLGDVPVHWGSKPLKYLCTCNDQVISDCTDKDYELEYVDIGSVSSSLGITKTENMVFSKAPSRARRLVQDGDVIISTVRTYLEAISPIISPPMNMVVSTGFAVIRPLPNLDRGFAAYCLRASGFIKEVVARSVGVSYPAINASDLVSIPIPSCPLYEQSKIATFLDHETAKIDNLIEKQQQLIELLKEKRQAVISHAVTKGINPNVPMKDSGVEWLGEVPEHWGVTTLRNLIRGGSVVIQDGNHGELHPVAAEYVRDGIPFLMANNIRDRKVDLIECKRITKNRADKLRIGFAKGGDMLLTHKGTVGEVATIPENISEPYWMLTPQVTYYRWVHEKYNANFFAYLFQSKSIQTQLEIIGSKQSTRSYVGLIAQGDLIVVIPPIEEQQTLREVVDNAISRFDEMLAIAETSIEFMQERRTALISAAVTGKIDVRNWVAPEGEKAEVSQEATA